MLEEIKCGCPLCGIEAELYFELSQIDPAVVAKMFSPFPVLLRHSSASSLLSHFRTSPVDEESDNLFRELFTLREKNPAFVETFLLLTFTPMLHHVVRLVAREQEIPSKEDIVQQVLSVFLEVLNSAELQSRKSHYAYAISRSVKREAFEWARSERATSTVLTPAVSELWEPSGVEEDLERYALRHFLHRCISRELISSSQIDLLIEFKLNGRSAAEFAALNGLSSNAVRQKFKRLLAKLRRMVKQPAGS
jgi:DNA-directed RNA polymerase specialized sigma24 family protein